MLFARLLVTVLRNATVATVKEELVKILELVDTPTQSIILAEVLSHHIQRVLVSCVILMISFDVMISYCPTLPVDSMDACTHTHSTLHYARTRARAHTHTHTHTKENFLFTEVILVLQHQSKSNFSLEIQKIDLLIL